MKQFLVSILAILYLGSSAGATVHMHYCKGKLVDISVGEHNESPCSGCKTKHDKKCMKSCCKDEHKMVKLEKDHQKSAEASFQFLQSVSGVMPLAFFEMNDPFVASVAAQLPFSHAPPRSSQHSLHILHCNFRI